MNDKSRPRTPPGYSWYDPVNGMRIGALTGGLLGAGISAVFDASVWFVMIGAAVGAGIGWWSEKRRGSRQESDV